MLEKPHSSHVAVKAGVAIAAMVLVVLVAMTAFSVVVGLAWEVIKIALIVAIVSGIWHMVRRGRTRSASRS